LECIQNFNRETWRGAPPAVKKEAGWMREMCCEDEK